ncbi:MAG: sulfurtransferase TusA family protein [Gammaproteobacteria bacterium]|nr:sulfurtransferase TusA family protein [Gammaproteobacteria bacterium]
MKTVKLDARNLLCPMPVIRVQNRVLELDPGTLLEATCTDPGVLNDIPAWCRINGHRIVDTRVEGSDYIITVKVGECSNE